MSIFLRKLVALPVCTFACAMGFAAACDGDSLPPDGGPAIVTIDTLARFQTMTGWEATAQAGQADRHFPAFRNSLFDQAVNDLGINRLRIAIFAGAENPLDFGGAGEMPDRCPRWNTVNDNDNPRVINPAGFHFTTLDSTVVSVVLPMRQRLEARGERLFLNLNYTAFLNQCPPALYVHADPAEYAEFILATFLHLKETFGLVPDAVEMILEPDKVAAWQDGTLIGKAIVATADRLAAAGFQPILIAPSTADLGRALSYLNDIYRVPGAQPLLKEISYHRYGGASQENLSALAERAKTVGARTAMLEHIGSGVEDLYADLTIGQVSAWQQYTLAFPATDNGAHYFAIVDGRVVPGDRTRYLRQYFHYVRMGAQRVGAQSTPTSVRAVAFENANQGLAVVVHADRFSSVEVRGLRPGNYGVSATTSSQTSAELGDQIAGATGTLTFTAPAAGVMTVYSK
ncbi:MAG: hypothetical protein H0W86_13670 [Armatimonadetes bacterium]|nr:hypothetical protein [Armatimonadota bacterium]